MRAEMEGIMRLWDEAQTTSAAENDELLERVSELKAELAAAKASQRRAEAASDDYF